MAPRLDTPYRPLLTGKEYVPRGKSQIADNVHIGEFSVLGRGVALGVGVIVDHHVIIEQDCRVGDRTVICYRAQVCAESIIGSDCVIGGFVGERSTIGDRVRIFGSLVHNHRRSVGGWDDEEEAATGPTINDGAFIAFGAVAVGAVFIGETAYIGANAVVRKDVPPGAFVPPLSFWG
jgi:UDP-3-O-[3-hydroxymyristoyl] glucosamine N-acyltransferase